LGSCTYVLATHPHIQNKVYEEIIEQLELSGPIVDYDLLVSKLNYMDLFIREVLRMYPVSIQTINRQCMEDTDVCGYHITKGKFYFN
jgi:cytochrome P450